MKKIVDIIGYLCVVWSVSVFVMTILAVGASELLLGEDAVYMAVGFAFSAWLGIVGFGLIRRSLQIYNLLICSVVIATVLNIIGVIIAILLGQADSIGYSVLSLLFVLIITFFFRSKRFYSQFNKGV